MPTKQLSLPSLRKKLTRVFNTYIRWRDRNVPCISCGLRSVAHAGHFFPTSSHPHPSIRFHEKNVNGQCVNCNTFQEGNRQGYARGLVRKYGASIMQELEICIAQSRNSHWYRFEYETVIKHYERKNKENGL